MLMGPRQAAWFDRGLAALAETPLPEHEKAAPACRAEELAVVIVWAPDRPEDQLVPATRYAIGDSLFGMEAYPGREGQLDLVLWSERIRAVIAGDTLIDLGNGLEIPASWLPEGVTVEQVATGLRPLLDKPVEFVLPTHGEPAGRAALERALA
jgi:hypothetical protein